MIRMFRRPRWKKWLFALVKLGILLLLAWFLRDMLRQAFADLKKYQWRLQPAWLVVAGLGYVLGLMPVSYFWYRLLRGAGQEVGMFETIRAWWLSQMVKYIPGKAMVLVVRTGMLRNPKIDSTVVAATVFVETLVMMSIGSLLALVILAWMYWSELGTLLAGVHQASDLLKLFENSRFVTVFAAFAMFVGMGLPTYPPILKWLVKLLGVGKLNPTTAEKLGRVPLRTYILGWLTITGGWFVVGCSLWATLRAIEIEVPIADLPGNTATVAMSSVAGFVSFIPGGAGVRELVQAELMEPFYGEGPSLIATILLRLVMLVSEVVVSSILYMLGPHRLKHKLGGPPSPAE
jgi:uncharacterized membrane protein YbhN (UPF0104 family)